jgi:hypothetical protein
LLTAIMNGPWLPFTRSVCAPPFRAAYFLASCSLPPASRPPPCTRGCALGRAERARSARAEGEGISQHFPYWTIEGTKLSGMPLPGGCRPGPRRKRKPADLQVRFTTPPLGATLPEFATKPCPHACRPSFYPPGKTCTLHWLAWRLHRTPAWAATCNWPKASQAGGDNA